MADILELIAPLSPSSMAEFCRAILELEAREAQTEDERWAAVFERIPAHHPALAEIAPTQLRTIYARLLASYPELEELTTGPSSVAPARAMFLRMFYELISRSNDARETAFMNLGYDYGESAGAPILDAADEPNRYSIQLYHQLFASSAGPDQAAGKDLVEVGCGRGGGCDYFARYLAPASVTGVDITRASIDYCRRSYDSPTLRFVVGQATRLPLDDGCCDLVVNLESSHCYPSMAAFLAEVRRILRPGGLFLLSDIRHRDTVYRGYEPVAVLDQQLRDSGLVTVERRDITDGVRRAIEIDGAGQIARWDRALAQAEGLREDAAAYVREHFRYAVGLTTDNRETWHERFGKRDHVYLSYVLRRP